MTTSNSFIDNFLSIYNNTTGNDNNNNNNNNKKSWDSNDNNKIIDVSTSNDDSFFDSFVTAINSSGVNNSGVPQTVNFRLNKSNEPEEIIEDNKSLSKITLQEVSNTHLSSLEKDFMDILFLECGDTPSEMCKINVTNKSTGNDQQINIEILSDSSESINGDSDSYSESDKDSVEQTDFINEIKRYNPFEKNNSADCLSISTGLINKISEKSANKRECEVDDMLSKVSYCGLSPPSSKHFNKEKNKKNNDNRPRRQGNSDSKFKEFAYDLTLMDLEQVHYF